MRTREAVTADTAIAHPAYELPSELHAGLLRHLPADQRDALRARFAEDRDYSEIAMGSGASEASIRQRVSRGLSALRGPLRLYRAAQELSREDRGYRFGGGHGRALTALGPREPLDCSSAASLVLLRAGVLPAGNAWTSGRLAAEWGEPGEGRYVTVWADEHHVWLSFTLDADHGERFDPTPTWLSPHAGWLRRSPAPNGDPVPRHWPGL
jgi:hypothetical protein